MVLPKATLTDTLIEGGLTPSAAERAAEMIALGYDEVAKQTEVDRRLAEQDRLNDANFRHLETTLEIKIDVVETTLQTKIDAVEATLTAKIEALGGKIATVDTRVTDLRHELNGSIQALKDSMDAKFAGVDAKFAGLDAKFAAIDAKFEAVEKQFAAVHQRIDDLDKHLNRRINMLMWGMGLGFSTVVAFLIYLATRGS